MHPIVRWLVRQGAGVVPGPFPHLCEQEVIIMSKWKFWKKVVEHDTEPVKVATPCPHCGKHILRQSTLSDFTDLTPEAQQRLPLEMTERVGMASEPRRYRGSI